MESTESSAVECTVGSIVWVRRRNGSWWPGKILGPEELGDSQVMSPRSGTPVKLLGREDASVDWYNLEKSKRVKAFRCGEFDDCIERAEASLGMPIKKREKYARREDAILHALELEKQLLKKQGKLGIASDRTSSRSYSVVKKESVKSSDSLGNDNGKLGNSKTHQFSKRLDTSLKDELIGSTLCSQKAIDGNQLTGEDDNSEVVPRMRGLQDFGLRTTLSKRKLSSSIASNGAQKSAVDDDAQEPSSDGLGMGSTGLANGKNPLDKRKRSHEELTEEFLVKRRDRRRPLVQVLQSSAKLEFPHSSLPDCGTLSTSISGGEQIGVICRAKRSRLVYLTAESSDSLDYKDIPASQIEMPPSKFGEGNYHPHPGSLIEENVSGSSEDVESDSSESDSTESESESESDSSETEPDMDEEMALLSGAAVPIEAEPIAQEHGSMSSEEPDELALSGEMSHLYHVPVSANEAVSKWQLKGKRNIRNLTKRPVDAIGRKGSNGFIYGTFPQEKSSSLSRRTLGHSFHRNEASNSGLNEANLNERGFGMQMVGLDNIGYTLTSRTAHRGRNSISRKMTDWEDLDWEDRHSLKGYWKDKGERFGQLSVGSHHLGGRMRSMLVDVDLKVQSSYQKEPVPIVSLMSKLNGKAIIGHPIQIEALEDGSSETLLSTIVVFGDEAIDSDGNTALPPAWRTARRTANFRVPRPHPSSAMDDDEAAEDFPFLDHQERKPPFKKSYAGSFGHKGSLVRKSLPHIPRPSTERKFPKKVAKKVSLSSSQKTRTLSSIAIEQNIGNKPVHESNNAHMDGLIKPESSGPPTVACIPVKLVFSRLLEKINRPPSKAVSNMVVSNSDTERNPS